MASRPLISQPPINYTIAVYADSPNMPDGQSQAINLPSFIVPPRATVRVSPRAGNQYLIGVARHRGDLNTVNEIKVLASQYLLYPVTNLNQIWVRVFNTEWADVIVTAPPIDV
jgi:hypothetical protein